MLPFLRPWRCSARRLAVALIAALTVACSSREPPLRVGVLVWPPYELVFLAAELGLLDRERVVLVDLSSPAEAIRAYQAGQLDAIFVTIDYVVQVMVHHDRHRVVLAVDSSAGGDVIVAAAGFTSVPALRGRRVGVEQSMLGAYMLARALELHDMTTSDVTRVGTDVGDQVAALRQGRVDAVVTYEPYATELVAGGAVRVFDSRALPDEIVDVLLVHEPVTRAQAATLAHLVAAWFEALRRFRGDPLAAARRLSVREQISPAAFLAALDGARLYGPDANRALLAGPAPRLRETLERHARTLHRLGLIARVPAFESTVSDAFLD